MQRLLTFLFAVALVAGLSIAPVSAQDDDATPDDEETSASGDPAVGDAVTYLTDDGEERGLVTVEGVTDPFEEFGEFFEPEDGARYIAAEITFENIDEDDDAFEVQTFDLGILLEGGYLLPIAFVSLDEDTEIEELEDTEVAPGDSVTGTVFFAVPEDAEATDIYYTPDSGRLIQLADLTAA